MILFKFCRAKLAEPSINDFIVMAARARANIPHLRPSAPPLLRICDGAAPHSNLHEVDTFFAKHFEENEAFGAAAIASMSSWPHGSLGSSPAEGSDLEERATPASFRRDGLPTSSSASSRRRRQTTTFGSAEPSAPVIDWRE